MIVSKVSFILQLVLNLDLLKANLVKKNNQHLNLLEYFMINFNLNLQNYFFSLQNLCLMESQLERFYLRSHSHWICFAIIKDLNLIHYQEKKDELGLKQRQNTFILEQIQELSSISLTQPFVGDNLLDGAFHLIN